jgi:hypothetical protein
LSHPETCTLPDTFEIRTEPLASADTVFSKSRSAAAQTDAAISDSIAASAGVN